MKYEVLKSSVFGLTFSLVAALIACSDSGSSNDVAGGVTDIGNSIAYTGRVIDGSGKAVASARVVAYYDGWTLPGVRDSVETVALEDGSFELNLDSAAEFVLYASSGDNCGYVLPEIHQADSEPSVITIGGRKNYSSHIGGRHTGSVRVVGSNISAELDDEGFFSFADMPPGDVMVVYTDSSDGADLQSRLVFTTVGDESELVLPELTFLENDTSWLTVASSKYYGNSGFDGVKVLEPTSEAWTGPKEEPDSVVVEKPQQKIQVPMPKVSGSLDGFVIPVKLDLGAFSDSVKYSDVAVVLQSGDSTLKLSSEVEFWGKRKALLWVRLAGNVTDADSLVLSVIEDPLLSDSISSMKEVLQHDGVITNLHLNGDAKVLSYDSTPATSVKDSVGLWGNGLTLKPGQFIDLDTLNPTGGDFTISLWTKWKGPNGHHQILVSQRAYWSDSTSRFQWHYEGMEGWFTAMKSMPGYPYAVYFGDSIPVGQWVNLVLVSRDHMLSMYVDGEVLYTSEEDGSVVSEYEFIPNELNQNVPFRIGGNEVDEETWNGTIDEIRIETIARDAEWIRAQYEAMKTSL